jgi:hypothetical protein
VRVREFPTRLGRVLAIAAPGVVIGRRDRDALHADPPLPQRARTEGVNLALPGKRTPWIKKAAVLVTCESDELKLPLADVRRQPARDKIVSRVLCILRAHWRESALLHVRNPAQIDEVFPFLGRSGLQRDDDVARFLFSTTRLMSSVFPWR